MKKAILFPGQGSQTIGMMADLAGAYPLVKTLFHEASDLLNIDLWNLTQEGPIDQLSQTEHTQPALLVSGVAAWRVWQHLEGEQPAVMAGHSLGEYTALCCAGAIDFKDAVTLVRDRGRYMQDAVPAGEGAMAAILGLDDDNVKAVCEQISATELVQAVNFNAPGQVVIAGTSQGIELAVAAMKEAGARRALPLPVSIPAHSSLMSPASERLAQRLDTIKISIPGIPVIHNCNVQIAESAEQIKTNLVQQLDSPVRWVECVQAIQKLGVNHYIESGPGKVLSGMVKRIVSDAELACIEKPEAFKTVIS